MPERRREMKAAGMISCGCCMEKTRGPDTFGHNYGCVCENHMDIPFGILPGKCDAHHKHRDSRHELTRSEEDK